MKYADREDSLPMQSSSGGESESILITDYYQRPFLLLHAEKARASSDITTPHPIRNRFWQLIQSGEYQWNQAKVLLNSYLQSVEAELRKSISDLSLAYCLHLYRRLSPGAIGQDKQGATIGLTRAILEAAFQKYAGFALCTKIAESQTIPIERVLGGLLMAPEFEVEREILAQGNQLVLTDFSGFDLEACYNLEKLAYEIWRVGAALRTTGKGANLIVCEPPECFIDDRSEELDFLVSNFDKRASKFGASHSATGVVFPDVTENSASGCVFLPVYNLGDVTGKDLQKLFSKLYRIRLSPDFVPNFVWVPFNLREYRQAHLPFSSAFRERYGSSFDAVIVVVAALCSRVFHSWNETRGMSVFRYWQRAYEGPCRKEFLRNEIMTFLSDAHEVLAIEKTTIDSKEIDLAINFWTLNASNRRDISLAYPGPHYLFLPIKNNALFVDYAWILRRLHDLFIGVSIPDQNFKGVALENALRSKASMLPTGPCKADHGDKHQIDYAAAMGDYLIIAECKAVARSIAFERGEPQAIKHHVENMVELALTQIDEKAEWLANNPVGTNYDISKYKYIVPVAVSPFVEFIPSMDRRYWLSKDIPRVLTPQEFEALIEDRDTIENAANKVTIKQGYELS